MTRDKFEHESLQDGRSIARYLDALKEGFASGTLRLTEGNEVVALEPNGLIRFKLKAQRKRSEVRVKIVASWDVDGMQPRRLNGELAIAPARDKEP